jgi:hypothetical protein
LQALKLEDGTSGDMSNLQGIDVVQKVIKDTATMDYIMTVECKSFLLKRTNLISSYTLPRQCNGVKERFEKVFRAG